MEFIRTPKEIWKSLSKEFKFTVDACASDKNYLATSLNFDFGVFFIPIEIGMTPK